ncbi:hypothetical protein LCGC14_0424540 [marine sediment metagenome]|uniref:DUF3168 domain-containing protein n=1 Tax=marine sediment metagenome TaxID=412755 RepID=A0A0F9T7U4_9ZZZZ
MTPIELQTAILTRLSGFTDLTDLLATDADGTGPAIYDHVPQEVSDDDGTGSTPNPFFPYIRIGEYTAIPFDTHSSSGSDNTITIHSWSRYRGMLEIKQIQRQTYLALHRFNLVVAGVDMIDSQWDSADVFLDDDGLTRHGVQRFRILLDEG